MSLCSLTSFFTTYMFLIQGDFVLGKRHGQGVYNYSDGGRYEGTWVDDRIEGTGTSYYANKNVYEGQVDVRNFKQIYCFNGVICYFNLEFHSPLLHAVARRSHHWGRHTDLR